ncbi:restriction endonuclease subunit S [Arenibacter amylolyticus]|uniref:restriction endonuclease subunit S n=1 Tax=Arenibacter amylolyticus TaxID=1406873 RepID=UPI000A38A5E1|nr:restriction endonuclease subunit S [Arenibacter amylolyticus]
MAAQNTSLRGNCEEERRGNPKQTSETQTTPSLRGNGEAERRADPKQTAEAKRNPASKEPRTPTLRFKEFEGEYVKSKLGNELNLFNGYAFSSKDSREKGIRWVKIADVGINEMKLEAQSYLPEEFKEKHSKFLLQKGDYVVALTRPILGGKLKIAKINDDFDGSLLNQRVGKLVSKNDLEYMYCMLQQKSLISRIENRIAGTDPPNLSPNEIATLKTYIPSLPEQQKIASFLAAVDKKIQQLTKKKELLEDYKKGVMQQLFSQKIRFTPTLDDFEEKFEKGMMIDMAANYPDWEEKKFGDLYSFHSTNSLSRDKLNYESGTVYNIHYGDIHTKFKTAFYLRDEFVPFINNDIDLSRIKSESYCKNGDLVIADASEDYADIGKTIELIDLKGEKVLAGLHTFLARPKTSKTVIGFFSYLLKSWSMRKQIMIIAQGTKVLSLSTGRVANLKLKLPSNEEQQKIANYLSAIDTKIEAVNQQIEKTQEFKKGLLQQMFV